MMLNKTIFKMESVKWQRWGANVRMEIIDAGERRRRQKVSAGFCGYNWMIDSIIKHGIEI